MPSYFLRPVSDKKVDWAEVPAGPAWSALDDPVTQPTAADTTDRAETTAASKTEACFVESFDLPENEAVTNMTAWGYMKAGSSLVMTIAVGGLQPGTNYSSTSYGWGSSSGLGVGQTFPNRSALAVGLQVQVVSGGTAGGTAEVAAFYIELTTSYLSLPDRLTNPQPGPQQ